jgi:hypothetical protein
VGEFGTVKWRSGPIEMIMVIDLPATLAAAKAIIDVIISTLRTLILISLFVLVSSLDKRRETTFG